MKNSVTMIQSLSEGERPSAAFSRNIFKRHGIEIGTSDGSD